MDATVYTDKTTESYELDKKDDESIFGPEETCGSSKTTGLSICTAAIFIIGEICGAGALSFPMGLSKSGIYGKKKVEIGAGSEVIFLLFF